MLWNEDDEKNQHKLATKFTEINKQIKSYLYFNCCRVLYC